MTNSLTLVSSGDNLPDYLKQLQYEDSGVGSGIAPRAPRLGITTSKQFTVTKDGQKLILPTPTVRGVIVAGAETITKAWYAKSFVPGTNEAPDCFSLDGKTPASGAKAPQCANCAACPKNAFGSNPVTGRGKACSDRKMVVFVWEGLPDELMTFNVPTMSLATLRKIDTELRSANIPMQAVMVELSFDPGIVYPVVKISAVGYVAQEVATALIEKSRTAEVSDLLRETDFDGPVTQSSQPESLVNGDAAAQIAEPSNEGTGRRRRRTKAEMEAAKAAEQATEQPTPDQSSVLNLLSQAKPAVQEAAPEPAETAEQREIRELQEKLAALQKPAKAEAAPEVNSKPQQVEAAAQPAASMDVTALLNKWRSN